MALEAICLDLAGVLYQGPRLLPGADRALKRLQDAGLPLRFVTNTSQRNRRQILNDLTSLGLYIDPDSLFTAPMAAHDYCRRHNLNPYCLIHPNLKREFQDLTGSAPNAVLLGDAGQDFTYENLDQAFALLQDGAPLIAMGENRYYQLDDGLHLDAGPFVRALEYATDRRAVITGKPAATFFEQVMASLGRTPAHTLMVGDDAQSDVQGALNAGLQGCLVQTGKYREGDEKRIEGDFWLEADIVAVVDRVLAASS